LHKLQGPVEPELLQGPVEPATTYDYVINNLHKLQGPVEPELLQGPVEPATTYDYVINNLHKLQGPVEPELLQGPVEPATTYDYVINNLHKLQGPVEPELLDNIFIALQTYPDCQLKEDCYHFLRSNKIIPFSHILLIQYILNDGVILKQFDDPVEISDTQNSNTFHNTLFSSILL
jgi:hypothetical protein